MLFIARSRKVLIQRQDEKLHSMKIGTLVRRSLRFNRFLNGSRCSLQLFRGYSFKEVVGQIP